MDSVPIITLEARALLWLILILTSADFSLSMVNFGFTSFFIGLIATSATIIHIITQLVIVFRRERGNWKDRTELLPPTSKLYCILMDILLAILFFAAFAVTVLVKVLHYFGSLETGGLVVYADATLEAVCGIAMVALAIVGSLQRRRFLGTTRGIQLPEGATTTRR